ncbi:MAG: peptidylprolyl isomerase [Pseudohongiella sp.]|nr:peptidylprolyl isomerase [Pseudohongiella sp.]
MINSKIFSQRWIRRCALALVLIPLSMQAVYASTFVQVNTSLGNFLVELLDSATPGTVNNFLNYVNSGRYNGTVIHRSVPDFVVQGGWLTFNEAAQNLDPIPLDPNIVNEPGISNTRGTIAMAKVDGDPDSANSQWFINLVDNTGLDSVNGGFTVFGRVLGSGMDIVDVINNLPTQQFVSGSPFPTINYNGGSVLSANLVNISMSVVTGPANYLEPLTNLLRVTVDGGAEGMARVAFTINSTSPEAVIQLNPDSIVPLTETVANIATFDGASGQLVLPELVVDGVVAYRNVVFQLSNPALFQFTAVSFQ